MQRRALRISYSQIQRLDRCPWAHHARHVRKLVPLRRKRPPPAWGDAYHVAAAVVWRARALREVDCLFGREVWSDHERIRAVAEDAALERLRELDVPGLDAEALAAECAQAAQEACSFVGPEWRVLWLDGSPVVEARLLVRLGETYRRCDSCAGSGEGDPDAPCVGYDLGYDLCRECEGGRQVVPVDLLCVLDLALVHVKTGVVRVVDHKTTTSWPEEVGDALRLDEPLDLDLRDDLQLRLYVFALRDALRASETVRLDAEVLTMADDPTEAYHLVRRATVGTEPHRTHNGRGPLSRAQQLEATEEQWMTAIRRHGLRVEDYEPQIAQARLRRWQAWAPVEFNEKSLDLARREALRAAEEIARYEGMGPDDVPRRRLPGRWMPHRPQRWSGSAPKTQAEAFAWSACAACDHRDLCVAEGQSDTALAALVIAAQFEALADAREAREEGLPTPCELDADEVD